MLDVDGAGTVVAEFLRPPVAVATQVVVQRQRAVMQEQHHVLAGWQLVQGLERQFQRLRRNQFATVDGAERGHSDAPPPVSRWRNSGVRVSASASSAESHIG